MASFDIKSSGLDTFSRELEDLQHHFPREARQLMLRLGTKAKAIVTSKAKQLVKKESGNYLRSIKRGKVRMDAEGTKVRVYSGSPMPI
ncbi:hypothetical protein ACHHV8_00020 [Paenibacillus sp. TAB 01]|uniref:hypothetical protein n=1 Tax=Paenibacillus sp. TAB 01 TaxID=3368988 RepID=UPI00375371AC